MNAEKKSSLSVSSTPQPIEKIYSLISLSWKIDFSQLRIRSQNQQIRSPSFEFCDASWELNVICNAYSESAQCYISNIRLICTGRYSSLVTVYLNHTSISDDKGKILREIPGGTDLICFCGSCCSTHELLRQGFSNYVIHLEDTTRSLTISLDMLSEKSTKPVLLASKVIKDEKRDPLLIYESKLSSDFEALYQNRKLSDVTLKLGDEEFPAHKLVLSARSRVFAAMFEHDMVENRQSTVDLVQMEAATVQDMLRYVYCAKVRELSAVEALNLYVAADRYDLEELRAICREAVARGMSTDNVFDIAAIADIHNDELLISELKSFISKNGKDIVKTEKWEAMSTNNPVLGMKIFKWLFSGE